MADLLLKDECYQIIGACFEVYKEKGCGFLEAVFQECLEIELELQQIPFQARKAISLSYKGRPTRHRAMIGTHVIMPAKHAKHTKGMETVGPRNTLNKRKKWKNRERWGESYTAIKRVASSSNPIPA